MEEKNNIERYIVQYQRINDGFHFFYGKKVKKGDIINVEVQKNKKTGEETKNISDLALNDYRKLDNQTTNGVNIEKQIEMQEASLKALKDAYAQQKQNEIKKEADNKKPIEENNSTEGKKEFKMTHKGAGKFDITDAETGEVIKSGVSKEEAEKIVNKG